MTTPAASLIAYADQFGAASRDASQALHTLARAEGVHVHTGPADQWLTDRVRDLTHALTTGTGYVCPHLPAAPRVVYAAAWAPGQVVCEHCTNQLIPDHTEDITCDRCRTRRVRHLGAAAFGPVLLGYGLCEPCLTATTDATEDHHS